MLTTTGVNSVLNALLGDLFGITVPGYFCVCALKSVPRAVGEAQSAVEVDAAEYNRKVVDNTTANWPDAVDGFKGNAHSIIFDEAASDWGVITGWGLALYSDHLTYPLDNTQLFVWGALDVPKSVPIGARLRFAPGDLRPFSFPFSP